jgi:hypothetical protein
LPDALAFEHEAAATNHTSQTLNVHIALSVHCAIVMSRYRHQLMDVLRECGHMRKTTRLSRYMHKTTHSMTALCSALFLTILLQGCAQYDFAKQQASMIHENSGFSGEIYSKQEGAIFWEAPKSRSGDIWNAGGERLLQKGFFD